MPMPITSLQATIQALLPAAVSASQCASTASVSRSHSWRILRRIDYENEEADQKLWTFCFVCRLCEVRVAWTTLSPEEAQMVIESSRLGE